jgi:hypothetical protein
MKRECWGRPNWLGKWSKVGIKDKDPKNCKKTNGDRGNLD